MSTTVRVDFDDFEGIIGIGFIWVREFNDESGPFCVG